MQGTRLLLGTAVIGCAALGLIACGDQADTPNDRTAGNDAASQSTGAAVSPPANAPGARGVAVGTATAALHTAARALPEGEPFDLETENTGAEMVFDTKVASHGNEFKVLVDATGTQVRSQQQEPKPSDDMAKLNTGTVTAAQALQTASSRVPDARFDEMEIDTSATGTVIWQIQLVRNDNSTATYTVDAQSGQLTGPR